MNQEQRLDYLIGRLRRESIDSQKAVFIRGNRRRVFRSLMNRRRPRAIDNEYLRVEEEYLKEDSREKGIILLEDIPTVQEQYGSSYLFAEKLSIWQGDITRLAVDAIVNAANPHMLGCFIPCHKCVDNAIHSAAGIMLREECNMAMKMKRARYGDNYKEPIGCAELTGGYNLPAKYVIHVVGPVVRGKLDYSHEIDLKKCYRSVMECALENGARSVSFCCISTGACHFPSEEAAYIAVETVFEALEKYEDSFDRVIFDVWRDKDWDCYEKILC